MQAAAAAKEQLPGILRGKLTAGSGAGAGAGARQAALVGTRPQAEQVRMRGVHVHTVLVGIMREIAVAGLRSEWCARYWCA